MTTAIVNDNAEGIWSQRVGTVLEYVCSGANCHHAIVRRPGERRSFGFPMSWLDLRHGEYRPRPLRILGSILGVTT